MRLAVPLCVAALVLAGCAQTPPPDGSGGVTLASFGVADQPLLGDPSAPVVLVAWEAPGCSSCRNFHLGSHAGSLGDLRARFVDPGDVAVVGVQWTIGAGYDVTAGVAAECVYREGGDAAYWDLVRAAYEHQYADLDTLRASVRDLATAHGFNATAAVACLDNQETRPAVQADIDLGRAKGARTSPAFFILHDGRAEGPMGLAGMPEALERATAGA